MKTMKCNQLGGPDNCNQEFHAETWEEMKNLSMQHGKEMMEKGDEEHLKAMEKMKQMMQDPDAMQKWMVDRKKEFDIIPENR